MDKNYTILHCHTMLSNATTTIDSVTTFQEYIEKAKEFNMTAMAISEHGSIMEWWHKKCEMENAGIKYIHACEVYVTYALDEKVRDNYHCLLIAKNYNGVKELNALVSKSFNKTDGHFYYSPRIAYNELINTSENIIICTACLGGILNKAEIPLQTNFLEWLSQHNDRCFLEIQHHNVADQITYNKKLIELSEKHNIPLVATTDTHCLNEKHTKGRSILQKSKNIYFEDEDGWDLCMRSYDELCKAFALQGIDEQTYKLALENTNKIANMIEPFSLDKDTKYPKIYDNPEQVFKDKINKGYLDNPYIKERYDFSKVQNVLHDEYDTYKKTGAIDFMLLQTYLREWEKENGVQCGYGRGSANGSLIAYLLNITQMDSLKFNLNFFRFMNPNRVSNADIDTDYSENDRAKVKEFLLKDHMGLNNIQCSEIITFNTIATKGAVKDVARAMDLSVAEAQDISNQIIDDIIPDDLRDKYKELFEYVDIVNGTVMSIGSHPSGVLITDHDIASEIGTCTLSTSSYPVSMLNMKELDDLMYVKLDILGLDGCGVINDTCKLVGIDRLTPDNVDLEDENVWKSIRDDTTLIFQWESDSAQAYLKKLMSDETIKNVKDKIPNFSYIKWFSFGNGLIRPACASYRDSVADGTFYENGLKELDEFLAPTLGRVTMQEDIMMFLVKFCGYSQAESDTVRRGIAKKKGTEQLLPEIEERFVSYTKEHFGVDEDKSRKVIKPFLQTILDASSYAFSWNHSDAYSCIGYVNGYLRYYYPLEFLTAAFNIFHDNPIKTQSITKYAHKVGIKIKSPQFGFSHGEYMCDKETNTIYKGLNSIKSIQTITADTMLKIASHNPKTFLDVLYLIDEIKINDTKVNSKNIEILIDIGFFSNLDTIHRCKSIYFWYKKLAKKKTYKKEDGEDWIIEIIRNHTEKETDKQFSKIDMRAVLNDMLDKIPKVEDDKMMLIKNQVEKLGYADCDNLDISPMTYLVQDIRIDQYKRHWVNLYQLKGGAIKDYELDKSITQDKPLKKGDIIKVVLGQKPKYQKTDNGWRKTGEMKSFIKFYSKWEQ